VSVQTLPPYKRPPDSGPGRSPLPPDRCLLRQVPSRTNAPLPRVDWLFHTFAHWHLSVSNCCDIKCLTVFTVCNVFWSRGAVGRREIRKNKWRSFNLCLSTKEVDKWEPFVIHAFIDRQGFSDSCPLEHKSDWWLCFITHYHQCITVVWFQKVLGCQCCFHDAAGNRLTASYTA